MRVLALFLLPFIAFNSLVLAESFPIQFARPFAKGQQFQFGSSAQMQIELKVTSDGKVVKEQNQLMRGSVEALVSIESVKEGGKADLLAYRIEAFSAELNGELVKEIAPGDTIQVRQADTVKPTYWLGDHKFEGDLDKLLGVLFPSFSYGNDMDQQIIGTDSPKAIGEEWQIHPAAFINAMKAIGMELNPQSVKGSAKLEGVVDSAVGKALEITMSLQAKVESPADGPKVQNSEIAMTGSILLPLDPTAQPPREDGAVTMFLASESEAQDGTKTSTVVRIEEQNAIVFTPVE